MKYMDKEEIIFMICATVLFLFFGGDPDLMDGIIEYLMKEKKYG